MAKGTVKKPYEAWPLDLAMLPLLPEEGSVLGYHHLGKQVKSVQADLNKGMPEGAPLLPTSQIQTRLRVLKEYGYVTHKPTTGGRTWQITKAGLALLRKHDVEHRAVKKGGGGNGSS